MKYIWYVIFDILMAIVFIFRLKCGTMTLPWCQSVQLGAVSAYNDAVLPVWGVPL